MTYTKTRSLSYVAAEHPLPLNHPHTHTHTNTNPLTHIIWHTQKPDLSRTWQRNIPYHFGCGVPELLCESAFSLWIFACLWIRFWILDLLCKTFLHDCVHVCGCVCGVPELLCESVFPLWLCACLWLWARVFDFLPVRFDCMIVCIFVCASELLCESVFPM